MYHLVDNLQTKAGDALVGYYVKLKNADGYAPLYSDENLTPIISVSGIADTAVTSDLGMYDIYVADGTYDIEFYDKNDINIQTGRIPAVRMFGGDLAADDGFTLIKHKPQEEGTYARTAAQRVLAGIVDDGGTYVNHWIDPDLDTMIALNDQTVDTNLADAFHSARDTAWGATTRGRTGAVIIPHGVYTVSETVEMGLIGIKVLGRGKVYIKQMASFTDPLYGVDADVERPRILSCDWNTGSAYVRNHVLENIIVFGNGSDSDAFFDRGVANSERRRLIARNVGGAVLVALAGVDSYYEGIQSLIRAEGVDAEQIPDYGVVVGRAKIGDPMVVSYSPTTQCEFRVRMEEAALWGLWLRYSDTNKFVGLAESLDGGGTVIDAASTRNNFEHFYCENNAGLDWDIYGSENTIGDQCTSYNTGPTTSIRVRSGAHKNAIRNCGNSLTVIAIDSGAEDTFLQNLVTRQINDSGTRTQYSGYIFQNAVSASVLHSQTFGNVVDPNTKALDWYEESTFTPTFGGLTTDGTPTFDVQVGRFTRIGNRVFFYINVRTTGGSMPTGGLVVRGLPYTAANTQDQPCAVGNQNLDWPASTTQISARTVANTTYIALAGLQDNAASTALDSAALANGDFIQISGQYEVA